MNVLAPTRALSVTTQVQARAGLPALTGAHELAWSFLLDQVFGRADHAGVAQLEVWLPQASLEPETSLRAELTRARGEARGLAMLDFGTLSPHRLDGFDWVAVLSGGTLAPRSLRGNPRLQGFTLQERRYVLTWWVRVWGAGIRLAYLCRRPDLADRASFGMRRSFARAEPVAAFYVLSIWSRR